MLHLTTLARDRFARQAHAPPERADAVLVPEEKLRRRVEREACEQVLHVECSAVFALVVLSDVGLYLGDDGVGVPREDVEVTDSVFHEERAGHRPMEFPHVSVGVEDACAQHGRGCLNEGFA